jgi:hypothetical protein
MVSRNSVLPMNRFNGRKPIKRRYSRFKPYKGNMTYQLKHKTIGFGVDPETGKETQGVEGKFFIPAYQRGYRWTGEDVKRLLEDIFESNGTPYSLQPIVVKPKGGNEWELIDGQQRLTTLWLILNFMKKGGWKRYGASYSLEYATRPGSQAYLQTLDAAHARENIDYFHLYQADAVIGEWFDKKSANEQAKERLIGKIHGFLCDSVRVIWYETPDDIDSIPLFTRLNRGRIALTDAELIKAVLLSAVAHEIPGRETEVAAQWDGVERDLQKDEIWAFVASHENVDADAQYSTRISLLLDTLACKPLKNPRRYFTFDALRDDVENDCLAFWGKVVALHAQVLGWFEEPQRYNRIGFLVVSGSTFGNVLKLAQGKTKQAVDQALNEAIKTTLNVKHDTWQTLEYESSTDYPKLLNLLLLFNVLSTRERFPFEKHVKQHWTLEHIHAQNAQALVKAEQWNTWLEEHQKALKVLAGDSAELAKLRGDIDALLPDLASTLSGKPVRGLGDRFNALSARVQSALSMDDVPDHTIANLALLSHGDNAALGNAVFEVKRQKILELDRAGEHIPVCTRNVFLKYYADANAVQPHFWGPLDKTSYLREMKNSLQDFFSA